MSLNPLRLGAAGAVAVLLSASFALAAPEAKNVADSIVTAVGAAGGTAAYQSATLNGNDVVVTNFKLTERGETMTIPSLVVTAPAARDKGGFTSPRVTFDGASGTADGKTVAWQTGAAEDVIILTADEIKARAMVRPFRNIKVTGISLGLAKGQSPITIDEASSDFAEVVEGSPRSYSMRIGKIKLGTDQIAAIPSYKHVLDLLGYNDFTVSIASEGGYDDKTDTLTLKSFTVDTENVGTLELAGTFSGMPIGRIATTGDTVEKTTKAKMNNLQVHFKNSGIVERVLKMQAEATGSTPSEVVEQATAAVAVTFVLAGNLEFGEKISTAIGTFLADPQSLTLTAAPPEPVTFGKIFAAAVGEREKLPDLLGIDVKANDK
jgi:hypothetical protein